MIELVKITSNPVAYIALCGSLTIGLVMLVNVVLVIKNGVEK